MSSIGAEALGTVVNVVVVEHEPKPKKPSTFLAIVAVGGLPFQPKTIFQDPSNPITLTPASTGTVGSGLNVMNLFAIVTGEAIGED